MAEHATLNEEVKRTGAKVSFADEAHFRTDAELPGKWVLIKEGLPWLTRMAHGTERRPATTRQCVWRLAKWSGWMLRQDMLGREQQQRNVGSLLGTVAREARGAVECDLRQRAGASRRGGKIRTWRVAEPRPRGYWCLAPGAKRGPGALRLHNWRLLQQDDPVR